MKKELKIIADHDGTLSPHDLGRDFLAHEFENVYAHLMLEENTPSENFVKAVEYVRNNPYLVHEVMGKHVIRENGCSAAYSPRDHYGVELALMTLMEGKLRDDYSFISALPYHVPHFRETVKDYATYIVDSAGEDIFLHVCSAGIDDCIKKPYEEMKSENNNVSVVGTRLEEMNGDYFIRPMGKKQKSYEVRRIINSDKERHGKATLSFGDSRGDADMLIEVYRSGGVPVSVGDRASDYATLVVRNDDSFLGGLKVMLAYLALIRDRYHPEKIYREQLQEVDVDGISTSLQMGKLAPRKVDKDIYFLVKRYD